jgi:hypothetical protein
MQRNVGRSQELLRLHRRTSMDKPIAGEQPETVAGTPSPPSRSNANECERRSSRVIWVGGKQLRSLF